MVAATNPPYAVPAGDGPSGTGLFVDGDPRVYTPATTPTGGTGEVDEVDTGFAPAATPDGGTGEVDAAPTGFTPLAAPAGDGPTGTGLFTDGVEVDPSPLATPGGPTA